MILATLLVLIIAGIIYWLFMSPYSQVFGKFPYKAKTKDKLIALTFDDGPNEPYTSELLDFFDKKNIKVTFFVVGKNIQRHPESLVRAHKAGHTIGNHSLSHQFHKYFSQPGFGKEILITQKIIKKNLGVEPALFRPPWLWRQPALFRTLDQQQLHAVSGKFSDPLEIFQPDAKKIARRTVRKIRPGSIIIFHDGFNAKGADRTQTVSAVKQVVETMSAQGYKFVTVDKLLGLKPYK